MAPVAICTMHDYSRSERAKAAEKSPLEVKDLRQTSSIRKKPEADLGFKKQQLDIF